MQSHSTKKVRSVESSSEDESSPQSGQLANPLISILFEVLGPIGHGPSSSHTMAPHRAAYAAFQKLGGMPDSVVITFYNSFAGTAEGHRTDMAIAAGLLGMSPDEENPQFRNALEIAKRSEK